MGSTDPNRYYMWTGWTGNDGTGGGPVLGNQEEGYAWTTYPERLQQAGISWKIYQDIGDGLDAAGSWGWIDDAYRGNYGDNSLLYFDRYRSAAPGDPLYDLARTGSNAKAGEGFFDILRSDVTSGNLPQISWIASPEAFTEHPNWPVNYGAWYTAQVLDALTADPDVWSKTALLITYDENDGFFDHVVPAYPSSAQLLGASTVSTEHENYSGPLGVTGPYGLGQRVPMLVVSPWSTGGWVCSQTFDHTSIIRLMERRFGVREPNITPWRRAVAGDLTSAFDFGKKRTRVPALPATGGYRPSDDQRHPDYVPVPPVDPQLPTQEHGLRPSRSLPYALDVTASIDGGALDLQILNHSRVGVHFQLRGGEAPRSYTVGAGDHVRDKVAVGDDYDLSLHGPNGYFRRYAGRTVAAGVDVQARLKRGHRALELIFRADRSATATVFDAHTEKTRRVRLHRDRPSTLTVSLERTRGWYDLTVTTTGHHPAFTRQFAGRVENGHPSTSDPLIGR